MKESILKVNQRIRQFASEQVAYFVQSNGFKLVIFVDETLIGREVIYVDSSFKIHYFYVENQYSVAELQCMVCDVYCKDWTNQS